jgi:hypothetical protein
VLERAAIQSQLSFSHLDTTNLRPFRSLRTTPIFENEPSEGNAHAASALEQILTLGDNTKSENQISPRFFSKFFSSNQDPMSRERPMYLLSEKQVQGDQSDDETDSDFEDDDIDDDVCWCCRSLSEYGCVLTRGRMCVCVCVNVAGPLSSNPTPPRHSQPCWSSRSGRKHRRLGKLDLGLLDR